MNYIEVYFKIDPLQPASEILTAELSMQGFESFVEEEDGLKAYIQAPDFEEAMLDEVAVLKNPDFEISFQIEEIQDQNWNAKWESEYEPVLVADRCYIRAPFHAPKTDVDFEIIIEPQMSFGTAHHETTHQMIEWLMEEDVDGKRVLDMGSGTAVLAILAAKKKAASIDAIDIDEWAFNNAKENVIKNNARQIQVLMGGAELLVDQQYDLVLANINKNILLRDMEAYARVMHTDSRIIFSGFYTHDLNDIKDKAGEYGLAYSTHSSKNDWVAAVFTKK
jgi:ribosomal protein L11 methyltransferase